MTAKPTIHETRCNPLSLRDLGGIGFAVKRVWGQVHRPERVNQCTCPHGSLAGLDSEDTIREFGVALSDNDNIEA